MKIIPGRAYRMRNGSKSPAVEPNNSGTAYIWKAGFRTYTADGREMASVETPYDLVAPLEPGAAEKLICDVTLEDYRRGVANVMGGVA